MPQAEHGASAHALRVLEFDRVLERVAARATSEPGRRLVLGLRPLGAADDVARELARVGAAMRFASDRPSWGLGAVPDVAPELDQLRVAGSFLDPTGVHRLGVLLTTSRLLAQELVSAAGAYAELAPIEQLLVVEKELEDTIGRSVDDEGMVLSTASKELKRIRDRLKGAQAKIVRQLEQYLGTLPERYVVPDGSVSIREGRYVIPVRREGKREVGGIVHDESQTGATLYVEPPVAIDLTNRLRDLEREEAREVRRILGELTSALRPLRDDLRGALDALADFDALHARARVAIAWEATVPEVTEGPGGLSVRVGRHPLLVETAGEVVVPFDLELAADERCLVVSGPNTGGKSVLLKAMGLIAALTQSGVVPPVGQGTKLPAFSSFFADIGDEQSIAQSLSTFSAHLANVADLVEAADDRSLVLIDEMGTGTDPAEGAALARAVIEELVARGATTLVTSHLGALKSLDADGSGIVNASLQFDAERMEPTYRLIKGRPGRSYGLAIARRLGLPGSVLDRAEAYRGDGEAELEEVLARLEEQERRAAELVLELDKARARTRRLEHDVEARSSKLRESERQADARAHGEARKMLLDARGEVEEVITELRAVVEAGASIDEAAREARRRVERAVQRHTGAVAGPEHAGGEADIAVGDHVIVKKTGARGRITESRGDRAMVEVGALRLEVPLHELRRADPPSEEPRPVGGGWSGPRRDEVRLEVDLRGLRVDEMEVELARALDDAIMDGLTELRIIHGKGTGALRSRVSQMLDLDGRVARHRMGGPTEGGAGVTVASFGATT